MILKKRLERKIMKYILCNCEVAHDYHLSAQHSNPPDDIELLCDDRLSSLGVSDVPETLRKLEAYGYLKCYADEDDPVVVLTDTGLLYFEKRRSAIATFLIDFFSKFFTGLVSGVGITLLSTWLLGLLKL
ncbi:MAG: hypothetical protein VB104_02590 [Candidatus Limiplasma sp.]|nr:hypothetical protein [Candidatus Limiplasma sp.]